MFVRCIGTGSSGNSYALYDNSGKILLLDLGMSAKDIKKAIDYRISDVVGAVVTHAHKDHSLSVEDFRRMGIPVFAPYESKEPMSFNGMAGLTVQAFDLTDLQGKWTHTNADGTECPCYGFLIKHLDMGRLLYITDTEFVKWRFKDINHIIISCNYQNKYIDGDEAKKNHVLRGHMELNTVKEFVKANNSNALRSVVLCHMSRDNAEPEECVAEIQKIAPQAYVNYARAGEIYELKGDGCPF